jgi:alpha-tubulin suppressor-like RCC1 family protein
VRTFLLKDSHGRVKDEYASTMFKVVKVAAGKNHSACLTDEASSSRVFTWGFGGYGRLGHRSAEDEFRPREVDFFSPVGYQRNQAAKQAVELICGSSFTIVITKTRHFYFFGMMSNSPRGEAQTYPKLQDELYDWSVNSVAAGSNLIVVSADDACVAWGVPVAGKLGLQGMAATTRVPKYVESVSGLVTSDVSCGYGQTCFIVSALPGASAEEEAALLTRFPKYPVIADSAPAAPAGAAGKAGAAASKKRKDAAPAKAAVKKGRK